MTRDGFLATTMVALAATASAALAQSPLGIGSAEPGIGDGGLFPSFFAWVNAEQQRFYRELTGALAAMRKEPWAASALVGLSFAYGIFHAAGPGHGKAVISAYMLANEVALKRGILLSFASALMQGLSALVIVGTAYLLLRGTAVSMTDATRTMEIASYAAVMAFGAWLLVRKIFVGRPRRSTARADAPAVTGGNAASLARVSLDCSTDHDREHDRERGHQHHGGGAVCTACGHVHAPDPSALSGERLSRREAWSAIVAVGLRPCSGALIVLTFALLNGIHFGGLASVLAMSLGTAITVSVLASLAVGAKGLALRYSGAASSRLTSIIEIGGAAMVFLLGAVLLTASFSG